MTNVNVRVSQPEDRPTLVKLMELLQEVERGLHRNRTIGVEIADAHLTYLEKLVQAKNGKIYVAQTSEKIVGFVVCWLEKLESGDLHIIESEREYGYISDLYVLPEMRQQGVGIGLMQAWEKHCTNLGLKVIKVSFLAHNHSAAGFYTRAGYEPYEVTYEKYL